MSKHPELRAQQIKLRRAEIAAALAESKHLYVSTGEGLPFVERTALESENAALELEALRLGNMVMKSKVFRRQLQAAELLTQLLQLLDERDLWPLAIEAAERREIALQEITPWRSARTETKESTHDRSPD